MAASVDPDGGPAVWLKRADNLLKLVLFEKKRLTKALDTKAYVATEQILSHSLQWFRVIEVRALYADVISSLQIHVKVIYIQR